MEIIWNNIPQVKIHMGNDSFIAFVAGKLRT